MSLRTSAWIALVLSTVACNSRPAVEAIAIELDEDAGPVEGTLPATDEEGHDLERTIVASPGYGTVTIEGDRFTYTPDPDFHGEDSFAWTASDPWLESDPAVVSITVWPVNDAPVAEDGSFEVIQDSPPAPGTLYATDVDGDPLTYAIAEQPAHGTVAITEGSGFAYTPDAAFSGADAFTFTASDGEATSAPATVEVQVQAVDDPPVAQAGALSLDEDAVEVAGTLVATDPDGDSLHYSLFAEPDHGTAVITDAATGAFTYTPDADFHGSDRLSFRASDGDQTSAPAPVDITVHPVNDAPVAEAGTLSVDEDAEAAPGTLVATDVDGDALTYRVAEQASQGEVVITDAADGSFTYTPDADFHGTDTLVFEVDDGEAQAQATVTLEVAPVNDRPVAQASQATLAEDSTGAPGTAQATDVDGDALTFAVHTPPAHGTLDLAAATGAWTYTPEPDHAGSDSFAFTASDGELVSEPATVSLSITAVDDPPVLADDRYVTLGQLSRAVPAEDGLLANDVDVDDPLVVETATVDTAEGGTAVLAADGAFTYHPPAGRTDLVDSFSYAVDSGGEATVEVEVREMAWFVDDEQASGDGTSEQPFATLAEAFDVAAAGDWIHVAARTGAPWDTTVDLLEGQHLVGAGADLVLDGELLLPAGDPPHLAGPVALADDATLAGFELSADLEASGTSGATLADLVLTDAHLLALDVADLAVEGVAVGGGQARVEGRAGTTSVRDGSFEDLQLAVAAGAGAVRLVVTGNELTGAGLSAVLDAGSPQLELRDNEAAAPVRIIATAGTPRVEVSGHLATSPESVGILVEADQEALLQALIDDSRIEGATDGVVLWAGGTAGLQAAVTGTSVAGASGTGLSLEAAGAADLVAAVELNAVDSADGAGLDLHAADEALLTVTARDNTVDDAAAGVVATTAGEGVVEVRLGGNDATPGYFLTPGAAEALRLAGDLGTGTILHDSDGGNLAHAGNRSGGLAPVVHVAGAIRIVDPAATAEPELD